MDLSRYNEALQVQLTESASGGIPLRVSWQDFDATGKFVAYGSDNATTVSNTNLVTLVPYDGVDDGGVRKITGVQFYNSDIGVTHGIRFLLNRRGGSATKIFSGTVVSTGSLVYAPETGWTIFNASGSASATGPTGPQGDVGPAGANGTGTTVEVHLGYTPKWTGTFTITDASITSTSKIRVWQANGPYTGKGTRADEAEMEIVDCVAYPATGTATVRWRSRDAISFARAMPQGGNTKTGMAVGTTTSAPAQDVVGLRSAVKRGAVWKYMKFTYQLLG